MHEIKLTDNQPKDMMPKVPTSIDIMKKLESIEKTLTALYEWTQSIDNGIRSAQSGSGMQAAMMRAMMPGGIPPLPSRPGKD